jgi:hypothetical protein
MSPTRETFADRDLRVRILSRPLGKRSGYITRLVNSPIVLTLLPDIMWFMTNDVYDPLFVKLHMCVPGTCGVACGEKIKLVLLAAWTSALGVEVVECHRLPLKWSHEALLPRRFFKDILTTLWTNRWETLRSFKVDEELTSPSNLVVKQYILKVLKEGWENKSSFRGWDHWGLPFTSLFSLPPVNFSLSATNDVVIPLFPSKR